MWVPLHVHSQYSILDATCSIPQLVDKAAAAQMAAVALTDQGNLYGAVEFFKAAKGKGIKPIIGCELYVAPGSHREKKKVGGQKAGYPIVLLAKDKQGYQNLCKLSSFAHLDGFYYTPRIDKELLATYCKGLICLSGPIEGKVGELILEGQEEALRSELAFFQQLFGDDFYLEITRHFMSEEQMRADGMDQEPWLWDTSLQYQEKQKQVGERLKALSQEMSIPLVATNDSRYMERADWRAQEVLMNISSGEPVEVWERDSHGALKKKVLNPKRKVKPTHELYFKSPQEMAALFADCPEALSSTVDVAKKCQFTLDLSSKFYPVFIPPDLVGTSYTAEEREKGAEHFLERLCLEAVAKRYDAQALAKVAEKYPTKEPLQVVRDRLAYELDLILSKGLCDYLLIVYDFIAWAKGQGIPMGPGRGSGAGSIVCYLTGITDIEPLRFDLFFERFINPERVSYPDIDVDICMERRLEVIDYTVRKYGKENVAQIITFGKMKAKMAIKDVGRVLSVPLAKVNEIAKLIPEDPNMTLDRAMELDPELVQRCETDEETKRLIAMAKILEGSVRNTGIHAAGLIISAAPLMEHIPICTAKDASMMVTQYSMKPVEEVGMLKIDFLGLKTLTALQLCVREIEESTGEKIDWVNLPLDNKETFELLNQGKTLGIFQLESGGMQELAKHLHIDRFEEIIAVGALYRPGPMEMIPSFIDRKHGREKIEFDHPKMKDILEETYGIMVYQEQVMMMAQRLAGYSLGQGDVLRKAMGKKDHAEMARQREKFREGAKLQGIDEVTAMRIFDKVEKFASYGFNKSHAAAYGYLSYATAYFKALYPGQWMAALMTSDRDDLTKVTKIIRECQAMGIAILPPDVNESGTEFKSAKKGIRFAMTAVKGVGQGVVEAILDERKKSGPFKSLYDFIQRIDKHKIGKKAIECLIEAGAFDSTGWGRSQLLANLATMYQTAQKDQKDRERGEMSLFSLIELDPVSTPPDVPPLSQQAILIKEKELLGFYLTGHPLDLFQNRLQQLSCVPLDQLPRLSQDLCRCAFVIEEVSVRLAARSGKKFAILTIGDHHSRYELPIWSELFEAHTSLLAENQLIYAVLQLDRDEDGALRLQCRWLGDLTQVNEQMVAECDLAYDRARMQAKSAFLKKNKPPMRNKESPPPMKKEKQEKLSLKLDADQMNLSHVLLLKELFRDHGGKDPVDLSFFRGETFIGKIGIDAAWGVQIGEALEHKLRAHRFIIQIDKLPLST